MYGGHYHRPLSVYTHPPPMQPPQTTLFAWQASLMRRGRGGGGQVFFYDPMCWELLFHFTAASEQLTSSSARTLSRGFPKSAKIPEAWRKEFKPPAAARPGVRGPEVSETHTSPSLCCFIGTRLSSTSVKFLIWEDGTMTRRSCAIYATGIVCAHLLIVGIALVVAQVFQTMIHSRLKKVNLNTFNNIISYGLIDFSRAFTFPPPATIKGFKSPQWSTMRGTVQTDKVNLCEICTIWGVSSIPFHPVPPADSHLSPRVMWGLCGVECILLNRR